LLEKLFWLLAGIKVLGEKKNVSGSAFTKIISSIISIFDLWGVNVD